MTNLFIFFGPPGSGKGTQANLLVNRRNFATVSTGNLIRNEIEKQTDLGKKIEKIISGGGFIPNETVFDLLKNKLDSINNNNVILDGFPRVVEQAKTLDTFIEKDESLFLKKVFIMETDEKETLNRIKNRLTCSECGTVFNLLVKKPIKDGICDSCGGTLKFRSDDVDTDIILHRNKLYNDNMKDIIDFYDKKYLTIRINVLRGIEDVYQEINNYLREV
jgi:adenylate kinase